ncbi:Hypothetical predicted protein [Podarcis lilfordi]|uniref:Uncharacterized protein n=1 Tax=Podarcis lilfordi TaxID=74358 RepID=A0AA35JRF4_9SAUR|nr:Hypothetical predicted protein [Podarcis lilfordi]
MCPSTDHHDGLETSCSCLLRYENPDPQSTISDSPSGLIHKCIKCWKTQHSPLLPRERGRFVQSATVPPAYMLQNGFLELNLKLLVGIRIASCKLSLGGSSVGSGSIERKVQGSNFAKCLHHYTSRFAVPLEARSLVMWLQEWGMQSDCYVPSLFSPVEDKVSALKEAVSILALVLKARP